MKIAGIIFLLFVSLSGMAQQAESPKERGMSSNFRKKERSKQS